MGETQRPAPLSWLKCSLSSCLPLRVGTGGKGTASLLPPRTGNRNGRRFPRSHSTPGFGSAHTWLLLKAWFDTQVPLAHRIPLHWYCSLQLLFMQHFSESHQILLALKFPPRLFHSAFLSIHNVLSSELANVSDITQR